MADTRVAVVAAESDSRSTLETYLRKAGFDVHPYERLGTPDTFTAVVVLGDSAESLSTLVEQWMACEKPPCVVVVTPKPRAFAELVTRHGGRLRVFPAPVFGWELVDALRSRMPGDDGRMA